MSLKTYLNITQKLCFPKKKRHFYSGINFMKKKKQLSFRVLICKMSPLRQDKASLLEFVGEKIHLTL